MFGLPSSTGPLEFPNKDCDSYKSKRLEKSVLELDLNVAAVLEAIKEQQQQLMQILSYFAELIPAHQPASLHSEFEYFDKSKENWEQYLQRLQQHLLLHGVINSDKKRALSLSCLDPKTFDLLQNLSGLI